MRRRANVDPARLARALAAWMAEHHLTQLEAAERIGVAQTLISGWLNENRIPSPASLARLTKALSISADDLAPPTDDGPAITSLDDRIVMIPRDGLVGAAGAGESSMLPDAADGFDADPYPALLLRQLTGINPTSLRSAIVVGDSIKKLVPPGTVVLYVPTETIIDHGLYVVDIDGHRVIKILQRLGGGSIALIPANKRYRTETFTPLEDADSENAYRSDLSGLVASVHIVGKVLWYPTLA